MPTGWFITLEGGEGAGKSTLQRGLSDKLEALGIVVVKTREPGGTPLAEAVRELVLHPPDDQTWSPLAEALLMNTARADHLEKLIRPSLRAGQTVICDRFSDSTLAYQSASHGAPTETLKALQEIVVAETMPDITIVLDVDWETAQQRMRARKQSGDAFEDRARSFHEAVRANFLRIANAHAGRCAIIDASLTEAEVLEQSWAFIKRKMETAKI